MLLTSDPVVPVKTLVTIHEDPLDRVLISQAGIETMTFLTADRIIARDPGGIVPV